MPVLSANTSANNGKQIPALDGVRGFAILFVLLIHLQQTGAVPARYHAANLLMGVGWCGVDLFFVLSGFLITLGLLETKGSVNYFSAFYMRRVLRIFPLYYLVLAIAIVCSVVFAGFVPKTVLLLGQPNGSLFPTWMGWIAHILYVQNWWMPWKEPLSRNVLGHFWSLGIEEQFYLVWPLCVWLLPRRRLLIVAVCVCAAVLALRFLLAAHGVPATVIYRNTVTRADTLMIGALCAVVVSDRLLLGTVRRWLPLVAGAGVCYIAAVGFLIKDVQSQIYDTVTFGFTAFALTFGAVVMWAYIFNGTRVWSDWFLSLTPFTKLGKYSYGLYVYHVPIVYLAKIQFGSSSWFGRDLLPGLVFLFGTAAVAFCIAVASYELFEKRFLRLKRFFKPAFKRAPTREAASPRAATVAEVT